jgi:tetratricopeptide (TPR) repeat protein
VAFAGLLGAWTAWTVERNAVWATELTLWTDTAAKAPSNPRALSSLGQAYLIRGETDRALEWLQAAIRANPDFYNAHGQLGLALMAKGDPEGALAAFERGRVLAPDKARFTYLVGIASQALGRWEDARHAYIEALRLNLNPEAAEAHMNLGAIDQQAGRWDNALIEYQAAYRLNPNLPEVTYGMGQIFQHQGRLDDAAGAYRETIRNDSSHVNAHIALAGVYVAQEKKPEAVETFEAALHLAPDVPEGHFQVARLLEDIGRSTEALAHYRRFITLATPSQAKALEWAKRRVAQIEAASAPGAPP